MSIVPLPEPGAPSADERPSDGIYLSAIAAYAGEPGAVIGVGFWPRAAAKIIDFIVHYFVSACAGFLFGLMIAIAAGLQHTSAAALYDRRSSVGFLLVIMSLLGAIAFEAICEGFHGSTPGKLILGMTVVREDGTPCRFGAALIRSLSYLIDSLFFGLIGYFCMQKTPQQQRHGDEWAHTVVCRRSEVSSQHRRGAGQFVVALVLAAMADAALLLIGLVARLA